MQDASRQCIECYNQVAAIIYRNICAERGLEVISSDTSWGMNDRAKILWDANKPDIVVLDKERKRKSGK